MLELLPSRTLPTTNVGEDAGEKKNVGEDAGGNIS
jgi:hypothetical protein